MLPDKSAPDFSALVDDYYQSLYRFALSLIRNETEASDLVQQTFLIWARKGDSLKDASKVKSWLFTTLYREFIRSNRRNKRMDLAEEEPMELMLPPTEVDYPAKVDSQILMQRLQDLDETYREPIVLFYLEDLSYKEIADILTIPIGTVMSRLSRGKVALKKLLLTNLEK